MNAQNQHRRTPRTLGALLALTATVAVADFCFSGCSSANAKTAPSPAPSTSSPAPASSPNPFTGEGTAGHVLAVKVDNVGDAQFQQTGLNSADLVYAIQVEGGLSRYLAVYDSDNAPPRVGPVRSARQTDIPLLAAFGRVGFAYSGAISGLLPELAQANVQNITPLDDAQLFSNMGSSPTYIQPSQIFSTFPDLAQAKDVGLRFGDLPSGGQPASSVTAQMPAATFTFTASGTQWLVDVDGHPAISLDAGQLSAFNVIIQHVQVVPGQFTDHNAAQPANEVFSETTGQGAADFYRDGEVFHGQWSKPTDTSPTQYTVDGHTMVLSPGRSWIVLEG
jgi:hypothetical protein